MNRLHDTLFQIAVYKEIEFFTMGKVMEHVAMMNVRANDLCSLINMKHNLAHILMSLHCRTPSISLNDARYQIAVNILSVSYSLLCAL